MSRGDAGDHVHQARLFRRDLEELGNQRVVDVGLLAEASGICRTRGIEGFWLCVNHENAPAIGFYQAQRFRRQGSDYFELEEERHENFVLWREVGV